MKNVLFAVIAIFFVRECQADVVIDISSQFDRDTIAVSQNEPLNGSYRNASDVFVSAGFSSPNPPGNGDIIPDPAGGFGTIATENRLFTIGPYDSPNLRQDNTWTIGLETSESIDITDARLTSVRVLFSAVGYNPNNSTNGVLTFAYTDASEQTFQWDIADSDGSGQDGNSEIALAGLDLFRGTTDSFIASDRIWFTQEFTGLDESKVVDRLTFSTFGVGDVNSDAEFGIYAINATAVPEPSSVAIFGTLIGFMCFRRRRS